MVGVAFPVLPPAHMNRRLEPPRPPLRLIIDTDAHNEIDDQFALAWALRSQDAFEIEGVLAAPYSFAHHREPLLVAFDEARRGEGEPGPDVEVIGSYHRWARSLIAAGTDPRDVPFVGPDEGMELSYQEVLHVLELLGLDPGPSVLRGAPGYLPAPDRPIRSDATEHLIERAMSADDRPLYVAALGALTNIASAILLQPRIVERIVVVWTSGFPSWSPFSNRPSLNLVQDVTATRLVFDCGVPLVYLPGFYIGAQLTISLPEMERWVRGHGRIGDYLYRLYTHNPIHIQRGITDQADRTWIMWDLICIAWLKDPDLVPSRLVPSPTLDEELCWQHPEDRHPIREAIGIDRDAIFRDFYDRLP
jgi:inosine-uridine nucleoside N-ribohydrolase